MAPSSETVTAMKREQATDRGSATGLDQVTAQVRVRSLVWVASCHLEHADHPRLA